MTKKPAAGKDATVKTGKRGGAPMSPAERELALEMIRRATVGARADYTRLHLL